jgi:hypothetical protein
MTCNENEHRWRPPSQPWLADLELRVCEVCGQRRLPAAMIYGQEPPIGDGTSGYDLDGFARRFNSEQNPRE